MKDSQVEWVEGDPFWPRFHRAMRWVTVGLAVVIFLTLFQDLGMVTILPYSTLGPTGLWFESGWIGLLLIFVLIPFYFPVAGPVGTTSAGLIVRGMVGPHLIARSRIVGVGPQHAFIRGWGGGEIFLTPLQAEKVARWFYKP
jgi:hypothetical protein